LHLDLEGLNNLSLEYENDSKAIKEELFRMCWYMRGSLSFTEAFLLTVEDRGIIAKIIEENLETSKTTQMPFF
jgi:hypothetical protein